MAPPLPNAVCIPRTSPPSAGPKACKSPVSICWNWLDNTFVACSNVVKLLTRLVADLFCSSRTAPASVTLRPNSIIPPCNLKNSTCPVTVALLNLSMLLADISLSWTRACSLDTTPDIKSFTTSLAPGMFCTSASADSVTGTPAFAIKSWNPSASSGLIPSTVPANALNLFPVSTVWPCRNA